MENRAEAEEIRNILRNAFEQIGNIQSRESNVENQQSQSSLQEGAVAPAAQDNNYSYSHTR